jgi:hypothetical protein
MFAFSISTAIVVTIPVHCAPACEAYVYITGKSYVILISYGDADWGLAMWVKDKKKNPC